MPTLVKIGTTIPPFTIDGPTAPTGPWGIFCSGYNFTTGQIVVLTDTTGTFLTCQVTLVSTPGVIEVEWVGSSKDTAPIGQYHNILDMNVYAGGPTTFTPQKLFTFQGQTWARGTDGQFYLYGGASNQAFDSTEAVATFTWLDLGQPEIRKTSQSVDYVARGQWNILGSMNFNGVYATTDSLKSIVTAGSVVSPTPQQASQQNEAQAWTEDGYFVQFQVSSTDSSAPGAVFSQLNYNFEVNDAK